MPNSSIQVSCSISGRHRAGRIEIDPHDPSIERARCLGCGHALMRSLVSRRWIISAYLGSANQYAVRIAARH